MRRYLGLGVVVKKCPPLYRQINRILKWRLHEPNLRLAHRFLGTWCGGWAIPEGYLHPSSIAYTVGVGDDISFDLALVEEFGCKVFAFDPTPMAVEFMSSRELPAEITFVPVGLSSHDGTTAFLAPDENSPICFSRTVDPKRGQTAETLCETMTLATMMKRLGHERVDLLKMDIEGFEYEVVDQLLASRTFPKCLLVEFHHMIYGIEIEKTRRAVENLLAAGYRIFWVSDGGREYGFIRDDETTADAASSLEAQALGL